MAGRHGDFISTMSIQGVTALATLTCSAGNGEVLYQCNSPKGKIWNGEARERIVITNEWMDDGNGTTS